MPSLPFCRPSHLRQVTWSLASGTSVGGDFLVSALTDGDPGIPLWIAETTIDLRGDLGSAQRVDGIAVIHHSFPQGTRLRLQLHDDDASWEGSTAVDLTVTVGAWMGRFAPHVFLHAASVADVATRTQRYIRITNLDAATAGIQIGELVTAGVVEELSRGVRVEPERSLAFGRSVNPSKKGVETVHDGRWRDRRWIGSLALESADRALYDAWQDDSYGVRPFLVWPLNDIADEPIYGRFIEAVHGLRLRPPIASTPFAIRELSCGEAY